MTKLVADHSLPLVLPIVRCFPCPVPRLLEFSDQVLALHLFFWRQLNRHFTGRFSLTVRRGSVQEQHLSSRRTTSPWFLHLRFGEYEHHALERFH